MDKVEKILWLIMVISLALCGVVAAYAEQRADIYETLRLNQLQPPTVCVFEANPEITDNWENIERVTYDAIYEWKDTLHNESSLLFVPIFGTIPWEDHAVKHARDYPQCHILINFEEYSEGDSLGDASIDYSHSTHKYVFLNIYLNQYKPTIVITMNNSNSTIGHGKTLEPLPMNTIKNVVLHEFGHGLGLGHYIILDGVDGGKKMYDYSIMIPSVPAFDEEFELSIRPNDILMIHQLYGDDGFHPYSPVAVPKSCNFINGTITQCNS